VITQALQGVAEVCKTRMLKPISLLWLAHHCGALGPRWCRGDVPLTHSGCLCTSLSLQPTADGRLRGPVI